MLFKKKKEERTPEKIQNNPFIIVEDLKSLKNCFSFKNDFKIVEDDLEDFRFFADLNFRRKIDAEVLSLISANVPPGKMLDIGTYMGNSAARIAANSPKSTVYTVNIPPDELTEGGKLVTGVPKLEEIGSFYREKGLTNVKQILANTKTWEIPDEIDKLSLVYVDGCHDTEFVYHDTKLIFDRVINGGFILWHDCSPIYRNNYPWIDAAMQGIELLFEEGLIKPFVLNVKHSWIGIWQKV